MLAGRFDLAAECRAEPIHLLSATALLRDDAARFDFQVVVARECRRDVDFAGDDVFDRDPSPGIGVDDSRRADHTFWKAVFAEAADLFEYALAELARDAFCFHRGDEAVAVLFDAARAAPRGHVAAE